MQKHNSKYKSDLTERCYCFSLDLIEFLDELPNQKVYWVLGDQLLRSGTSIGANVIEAKASSSKREFKKFHEIALKSGNEAKYWLCLLRDSGKVSEAKVEPLLTEVTEIANMLAAGIMRMKGKK